jgi:hypothetical protein
MSRAESDILRVVNKTGVQAIVWRNKRLSVKIGEEPWRVEWDDGSLVVAGREEQELYSRIAQGKPPGRTF